MAVPTVIAASEAERPRAIATLVTAFATDPFIRWMLPEPHQYLTYFPQVLQFFGGRAFEQQSAYRSQDFLAAALWLPPGIQPDEEALGAVIQEGVNPALMDDVGAVLEQAAHWHPATDHW